MKEIKRIPIVQQVAEGLKEYITSGEVAVGDKLPTEKELCDQFGVGRGTIREAICSLQAIGFVQMHPGKGAFVASTSEPSNQDIMRWFAENEVEVKDVIEVRSVIEPLAIKLAMEHSTKEDKQKLEEIHQETLRAVGAGEVLQISRCDEEFHTFIVKCSRNKMLISINKQVSDYLKNFRGKTFQIPHNVQNVIPAHTNILNAFLEGDIGKAQECMANHMKKIMDDLELSKDYNGGS